MMSKSQTQRKNRSLRKNYRYQYSSKKTLRPYLFDPAPLID